MKICVGVIHNHEIYSSYPQFCGLDYETVRAECINYISNWVNDGCATEYETFECDISDILIERIKHVLWVNPDIEIFIPFAHNGISSPHYESEYVMITKIEYTSEFDDILGTTVKYVQ